MQFKQILSVAGVLVGTWACASQPKSTKAEALPVVKVERLFPQAQSLEASLLLVKISIGNPQSEAVTLNTITYEVDTGDVAGVIEGVVDINSAIDSEQLVEAEFEVEIPFSSKDKVAYLANLAEDTIPLTVRGHANFEKLGALPFERAGAVATPSLPKFVIHEAQAARYGDAGLDVTYFLRLINENPFTVTVGDVNYAVEVYGKTLKEQQAGIGATLVSGAAQEFEVSVVLEEATFPGVSKRLKTGTVEYRVFGKLTVGDVEQEFDYPGEINIDLD
jgi:LEA14-like dessication related protein